METLVELGKGGVVPVVADEADTKTIPAGKVLKSIWTEAKRDIPRWTGALQVSYTDGDATSSGRRSAFSVIDAGREQGGKSDLWAPGMQDHVYAKRPRWRDPKSWQATGGYHSTVPSRTYPAGKPVGSTRDASLELRPDPRCPSAGPSGTNAIANSGFSSRSPLPSAGPSGADATANGGFSSGSPFGQRRQEARRPGSGGKQQQTGQ